MRSLSRSRKPVWRSMPTSTLRSGRSTRTLEVRGWSARTTMASRADDGVGAHHGQRPGHEHVAEEAVRMDEGVGQAARGSAVSGSR